MSSKIIALLSVAVVSCLPAMSGAAQTTGLDLVKSSNCLACHRVQGRRVGPAFTLIAQRFAGQPGAADYLAHTIRSGGRGRWGPVPMPAQLQVSPAQASAIAAWILSLADGAVSGKTGTDTANPVSDQGAPAQEASAQTAPKEASSQEAVAD